jgi:hypothetical protein
MPIATGPSLDPLQALPHRQLGPGTTPRPPAPRTIAQTRDWPYWLARWTMAPRSSMTERRPPILNVSPAAYHTLPAALLKRIEERPPGADLKTALLTCQPGRKGRLN